MGRVFMQRFINLTILLFGICSLLMIFGCPPPIVIKEERPVYTPPPEEPGPPPWAPAHGHRAKHRYYYYPESYVYFDAGRRVYFYYYGNGWRVSVSLPAEIHIDVSKYVMLDMDADEPYQFHSDVVKRYPPGQLKKLDDDKDNGKGKGKGKGKSKEK